jgi:hypothetical protein
MSRIVVVQMNPPQMPTPCFSTCVPTQLYNFFKGNDDTKTKSHVPNHQFKDFLAYIGILNILGFLLL